MKKYFSKNRWGREKWAILIFINFLTSPCFLTRYLVDRAILMIFLANLTCFNCLLFVLYDKIKINLGAACSLRSLFFFLFSFKFKGAFEYRIFVLNFSDTLALSLILNF